MVFLILEAPKHVLYLFCVLMNKESRETLHGAVRRGDLAAVQDMVSAEGGRTLARAQNSFGRNALHIAVLAQHEDIVAYLAENCPELLRLGDNVSIDVGVVDSAKGRSQLDIIGLLK